MKQGCEKILTDNEQQFSQPYIFRFDRQLYWFLLAVDYRLLIVDRDVVHTILPFSGIAAGYSRIVFGTVQCSS